jgi:hypothetical protein
MPVGSAIVISTDEGHAIQAKVTAIHEQTGGSDRAPGMTIAPDLAGEALEAWWRARVTYPEEHEPRTATEVPVVSRTSSKPITVHPRPHTVPDVAPEPTPEDEPPGSRTVIMPALDQETLEQLTRSSGDIEPLVRSTGEHEVVDDGRQTTIMEAIDPATLGLLDTGNSGQFAAVDEDGHSSGNGNGDDKKAGGGGAKKKRKRR